MYQSPLGDIDRTVSERQSCYLNAESKLSCCLLACFGGVTGNDYQCYIVRLGHIAHKGFDLRDDAILYFLNGTPQAGADKCSQPVLVEEFILRVLGLGL